MPSCENSHDSCVKLCKSHARFPVIQNGTSQETQEGVAAVKEGGHDPSTFEGRNMDTC